MLLSEAKNFRLESMQHPSPEAIWSLSEKELLTLLDSGFFTPKPKEIRFYAPSFTYYKTKYYCSTPNSFPTIFILGHLAH